MKRIFAGTLSVLLVVFLSSSFNSTERVIDKDIGYSLTIDQNIPILSIPEVQNPVIAGEVNYLLERGVSSTDKGLSNNIITFSEEPSFECNLYYTIDHIDLKLPALSGYPNQIDKYPHAFDLGFRQS